MKIRQIAQQIRAKEAELRGEFPSGDCLLMSLKSAITQGGLLVQVPLDGAARHLIEGTHRLATSDEVELYRREQEERRRLHDALQASKTHAYIAAPIKASK